LGGVLLYIAQKKESDRIMSTKPSIIVTRLDVQRLERLIDSLDEKTQDSPGVLALQDELDRAETVGHEEIPAGVVTMNSRVHCREEASGKDYHLTLVYPKDANADEGKISILAPIGSALLGLSVGEKIDWPAPGGKTLKLELLAVEYQPEAAGDFDL
jgi:regulator of nucleoside diphosphate kinase